MSIKQLRSDGPLLLEMWFCRNGHYNSRVGAGVHLRLRERTYSVRMVLLLHNIGMQYMGNFGKCKGVVPSCDSSGVFVHGKAPKIVVWITKAAK